MGQRIVAPSIHEAECIVSHDIFCKTNAARAKDTTFVIENNARAEVDSFWLMNFLFDKPTL